MQVVTPTRGLTRLFFSSIELNYAKSVSMIMNRTSIPTNGATLVEHLYHRLVRHESHIKRVYYLYGTRVTHLRRRVRHVARMPRKFRTGC